MQLNLPSMPADTIPIANGFSVDRIHDKTKFTLTQEKVQYKVGLATSQDVWIYRITGSFEGSVNFERLITYLIGLQTR